MQRQLDDQEIRICVLIGTYCCSLHLLISFFFPLFCRRFRQQKDLARLRERQFRLKQHYVEIVQILGL